MAISGLTKFLKEFPEALHQGNASIFIGAGVSIAAGYPSWTTLLKDIGEELSITSADIHDLAALAQWHIRETGGATGVRNVIKKEIGPDLPIPDTLGVISRLPVQYLWTTNYDRLVERSFAAINRPIDVISCGSDLALKAKPGAARLYKMHGSVERFDDIVISTDDYELYRSKRGAFLPLLQAHLTSMSILFVGLSLTDPNIKHVLSLIRESFTDQPPEHFAIVRPPQRRDCKSDDEFRARSAQHSYWAKDLGRYGLVVIEVENYDGVPDLLRDVERRVAAKRVWISGSWPLEDREPRAADLYRLAERLGGLVAETGRDLVTGSGLLVGSASIAGFIAVLRRDGGWDLNRRLIARPFPQPIAGVPPDEDQWSALRDEMARQAGIAIFLGGAKIDGRIVVKADGVLDEYARAENAGSFLLPVGSTGGAAAIIAGNLRNSVTLPASGPNPRRPTDSEIDELMRLNMASEDAFTLIRSILERIGRAT